MDQLEDMLNRQQLDFTETLERIASERLSFARFGDGEFKSMLRPSYNLRFQPGSPELAAELRSVFTDPHEDSRCLVGFPTLYRDLHWSRVWIDIWPEVRQLIHPSQVFGNAHVSRPILFQTLGGTGVSLWRSVWHGRKVVLVTGKNSRMTLSPELFDNVSEVTRIDSVAVDAFSDLPRVLGKIASFRDKDHLFLIALGPAGTILASKLAKLGEQAIDVGHISDSFETVFQGAEWPEKKPLTR
ncbi:GT-D fold domain-containing glycosyltransferase [Leucobacter komagatae]|nr:GT-D fold domain-containing glycosyltransferase [Leucobacter komagatae]